MTYSLAPLADFTDAPFRSMCSDGGADLTYTEMVSAAALAHGNAPTRLLCETMPGEGPVACQIFGADEAEIAFAAREIDKIRERFVELNLNAGCPMPRIMQTGAGGTLAGDPDKVFRLLKAMKENTSLPVTLKTRLGLHRDKPFAFELLDAAERAGAAKLVVHARSVSQKHGGPLNLELLAETVERADIPVVGNGSIRTREDVAAMAKTGVSGVMIGRAALADPAIFAKLKGFSPPEWSAASTALEHLERILAFYGPLRAKHPAAHVPDDDAIASIKMHTHLFRYCNGRPGAAKMRARLSSIRTLAEVRDILGQMTVSAAGPAA